VNTSFQYKSGVKHFPAKKFDKAYMAFSRVLREKPYDANANYYMARVSAARGDHDRAIGNYKLALSHYTGSPILLAGLGGSYVKSNQPDKAREILVKLESMSKNCDNVCTDAPLIATSLHVVAMSIYPAPG